MRLLILVLCLAEPWLFSPSLFGIDPPPEPVPALVRKCDRELMDYGARNAIWSRAVLVFKSRVNEDPFAATSANYVNPNEFNHHALKPYLGGKGTTYLGVGTFRALNTGVMGNFSDIVLMDYDLGTAAFNRLNLALILSSVDRFQYLNLLFLGDRQSELLDALRAGEITETEFVWRISRFSVGGKGNRKLKAQNLPLPFFSSGYAQQVARWSERPGYTGTKLTAPHDIWDLFGQEKFHISESVFAVAGFQKKPELWAETYLGSDDNFFRLKRMISNGHVFVLCGDLAGEETMADLAFALNLTARTVGLVDVSNAPDWLESNHDSQRRAKYFANLRGLPWAEKGMLLSTGGFIRQQPVYWGQSLISHRHLNELERYTTPKPTDAEKLKVWVSANDHIYGPNGKGKVRENSVFIWE